MAMHATTAAFAYVVINELTKRRKLKRKRNDDSSSILTDTNSNQPTSPKIPRIVPPSNDDVPKPFPQMAVADFEHLLTLVEPIIQDQTSNIEKVISPREKLTAVLKYLVTSQSLTEISNSFDISTQNVYQIVTDVCTAIVESLKSYMKVPYTEEEWLNISQEYEKKWDFPHCLGAIDGRHILLQLARMNSINTTRPNAITLLTIVDASYNFIYVNVDYKGHLPCTNVFQKSGLCEQLKMGAFKIPPPEILETCPNKKVPYMFVTNDAFNLSKYTIKPFKSLPVEDKIQRVFNYRLTRAGHTAENALGVLASVFKILKEPIELNSDRVKKIILATVSLHNYLMKREDSKKLYVPQDMFDNEVNGVIVKGSWRNDHQTSSFLPLRPIPHKEAINAERIRLHLAKHFIETGAIQSQNDYLENNVI